jgi:hypothetical protein
VVDFVRFVISDMSAARVNTSPMVVAVIMIMWSMDCSIIVVIIIIIIMLLL